MPITASRKRPSRAMAAELKIVRTPAEEALNERFPALKASLPGGANIVRLREAAFERVARRGLPNRRVEEWKYTDLRALMYEAPPPSRQRPRRLPAEARRAPPREERRAGRCT